MQCDVHCYLEGVGANETLTSLSQVVDISARDRQKERKKKTIVI